MKPALRPHNSKAEVVAEEGMVAKVDQGREEEEEAHIWTWTSFHSEKCETTEAGKEPQQKQVRIQKTATHNKDSYY